MHAAAMEASKPARYPDMAPAMRAAFSAEVRSESITSDIGGGGGGSGDSTGPGLAAASVVDGDAVILPVARVISADRARACAPL